MQTLDYSSIPVGQQSVKALIAVGDVSKVQELGLNSNNIGPEGAKAIAALCTVCGSLTSLDLSFNNLGTDGAAVLAPAIAVCASLTRMDVRGNDIAGDSASQLSASVLGHTKIEVFNDVPIKEMRADSFTELDLSQKYIGVEGAMVVAGLLPAMPSVTSLSLACNKLGDGGAEALSTGLKENKSLKTLDLSGDPFDSAGRIGPRGATALASAIAGIASLTRLDVSRNYLDRRGNGVQLLRDAVREREGFVLIDDDND